MSCRNGTLFFLYSKERKFTNKDITITPNRGASLFIMCVKLAKEKNHFVGALEIFSCLLYILTRIKMHEMFYWKSINDEEKIGIILLLYFWYCGFERDSHYITRMIVFLLLLLCSCSHLSFLYGWLLLYRDLSECVRRAREKKN